MNASLFIPNTSMSPCMELTICHAKRLLGEKKQLVSIMYGTKVISSHSNLAGSKLEHLYTLARQRQFRSYVPNTKEAILDKNKSIIYGKVSNINEARESIFYNGVMSSLATKFRVSDDSELNRYWQKKLINLVNESSYLYSHVKVYINDYDIDLLGIFNGRFFDSSAILKAAVDSKKDYFVYDINKGPLYFFNCSLHNIKENQKKARKFFNPKSDKHLKIAHEYYFKRRNGERTYEKSYTSGQSKNKIPDNLVNKNIIAIYPSSDDEYRYLDDSYKGKVVDQVQEITEFAEYLLANGNIHSIAIRMHPNMASMPKSSLDRYFALDAIDNVYVIKPLDKTDTYALLDVSKITIGFCSSIICESAYSQKQTILIGPSPFIGLGMGNEFNSGKSAAEFITNKDIFHIPDKKNCIMWGAYMNLYEDDLPLFSIRNSLPLVDNIEVPPLTKWRLLSAFSKLIKELFFDNQTSLTKAQRIRFLLLRAKVMMNSQWIK